MEKWNVLFCFMIAMCMNLMNLKIKYDDVKNGVCVLCKHDVWWQL